MCSHGWLSVWSQRINDQRVVSRDRWLKMGDLIAVSKQADSQFDKQRRGRPPLMSFSIAVILRWADAHKARIGEWPKSTSGPVVDGPARLTWEKISYALCTGARGLPGDITLRELLHERRGVNKDGRGRPTNL